MSEEGEETTLDEVIYRIREGEFYYDYDWASGPALRALERARKALDERARFTDPEFEQRAGYVLSEKGPKMSGLISAARQLVAEFGREPNAPARKGE